MYNLPSSISKLIAKYHEERRERGGGRHGRKIRKRVSKKHVKERRKNEAKRTVGDRLFGNTLLVIRILAYLGNSKLRMATRPCVIGGIDSERVEAARRSAPYIPDARCDSLLENNGISWRNDRLPTAFGSLLQESLVILYVDMTSFGKIHEKTLYIIINI